MEMGSRSDIYTERRCYTLIPNVYTTPRLGVSYDNATGFGAGISLMNLYYTQPRTPDILPSDLTLFGSLTLTGYYTYGMHGTNFFSNDLYRLDFSGYTQYLPSDFWGMGFQNALSRSSVRMKQSLDFFGADFAVRIAPFTYLGAGVRLISATGRLDDLSYLDGQRQRYDILGAGAVLTWETRDNLSYSTHGIYLRFRPYIYPRTPGNDLPYWGAELTANYYRSLWTGAVVAFDLHSELNDGQLPWPMMPIVGGPSRMRGYYMGRFRDNNIVELQAEQRQHIVSVLGAAAWVGGANVFPSLHGFEWDHSLPSYGGGIRLQADRYTRVRIDAGFGRDTWGIVAGLHEAF